MKNSKSFILSLDNALICLDHRFFYLKITKNKKKKKLKVNTNLQQQKLFSFKYMINLLVPI